MNGRYLSSYTVNTIVHLCMPSCYVPVYTCSLTLYFIVSLRYTLNTCVEPPHDRPVTSITFQPRHHTNKTSNQIPLLVSTSLDGHFKTWVLLGEEVGVSWSCQAVGYYHGLESVGAYFSEDGSLLAVNFKTVSAC